MKIKHYLLVLAAILGLTACNTDSNMLSQYIDIVTVDASSSAGTTLSFQPANDLGPVTLTTNQVFSADQIGKRVVILYTGLDESYKQFQSGSINIITAIPTLGGGSAVKPAEVDTLNNWASDEIAQLQYARSGQYLNLGMLIDTSVQLKKFACYYDITTIDNEYPELHLIMEKTPGYDPGYSNNFWGSYNIAGIWNRPSCKGLKIIYNSGDKSGVLEKYQTNNQ